MLIEILGRTRNHQCFEEKFIARDELKNFIVKHKMKLKISLYISKKYKIYEPK